MTVRFMLGLGLIALLAIFAIAVGYSLYRKKSMAMLRKRRWRRPGKAIRIDNLIINPDDTKPSER